MSDPLHSLAFSIYENPGVYCILLGSGVSRAAEIPTGWEITRLGEEGRSPGRGG